MRSPAVSSMSISRAGGAGRRPDGPGRVGRLVVSLTAETTTTTSLPAFFVSTMQLGTRDGSDRHPIPRDPPYFCTTSATPCSTLPERWNESQAG